MLLLCYRTVFNTQIARFSESYILGRGGPERNTSPNDANDVTIATIVICYPNQRPWLKAEVRALLKTKYTVRKGDISVL